MSPCTNIILRTYSNKAPRGEREKIKASIPDEFDRGFFSYSMSPLKEIVSSANVHQTNQLGPRQLRILCVKRRGTPTSMLSNDLIFLTRLSVNSLLFEGCKLLEHGRLLIRRKMLSCFICCDTKPHISWIYPNNI